MSLLLLHRAITQQRTRQFDLLISQGISIHQRDNFFRTPLHIVNEVQDESIAVYFARVLLENGARVNFKDSYGHTPFYNAVIKQRVKLVKLLLKEREIDFLECDEDGTTPLHYTAVVGNEVLLNVLVRAMRKVALSLEIRNHNGETPLMLATRYGHSGCQKIIMGKSRRKVNFMPCNDMRNVKNDGSKEEIIISQQFRIKFPEICENLSMNEPPKRSNAEQKTIKDKSVKRALPNIFNTYKIQLVSNYRPPATQTQTTQQAKTTDNDHGLVPRKRSMSCGSLSDLSAIRDDLSKGNLKKMPTDLSILKADTKRKRLKDAMIRLSKEMKRTRSLTK